MATAPSIMSIRASSFGGLFDCALRWEQVHLRGLHSPSSPRALIGTGVHAATAAFDTARMNGAPMRLDDAAGVAVDAIAERIVTDDVRWSAEEPDRKAVESIALRVSTNYCADISPRYEFAAVELTTKPLDIDCGGGVIVRLTGTLDRARAIVQPSATGTKRRIADVKTGMRAVTAAGEADTRKHRPQIGTYQLLDEHTTGEKVDDTAEVIGLNTGGKFNTGVSTVRGSKQLLLGSDAAPGLIDLAAQMFRSGLFPPNPQSFLCSAKYCPHFNNCPYGGAE